MKRRDGRVSSDVSRRGLLTLAVGGTLALIDVRLEISCRSLHFIAIVSALDQEYQYCNAFASTTHKIGLAHLGALMISSYVGLVQADLLDQLLA